MVCKTVIKRMFSDLLGRDLTSVIGSYLYSSLFRMAVTVLWLSTLPTMGSHHWLGTDTCVCRADSFLAAYHESGVSDGGRVLVNLLSYTVVAREKERC